MKKVLLDFKELSDSKEYYSNRPNPFIAIFIYCILALLAAAFTYSYFGRIEIVARSTGTILPNERIGSVSSLTGGRIMEINFHDGQTVTEGDILLTVDSTELLLSLTFLQENRAEAGFRLEMQEKYILSLQEGKNHFSGDRDSEEYPYYVQYENYALALLESENNLTYEENKVRENINALGIQITDLNRQINGQKQLKASIESGSNKAGGYPEYENQYRLYEAALEGLTLEYESRRQALEADTALLSGDAAAAYYEEQIQGYVLLLSSLREGKNAFNSGDSSIYHGLYKDYQYQLEQYRAASEKAKENYQFLRDNKNENNSSIMEYQRTMLEGYTLFRQSVNENRDAFSSGSASYAYRYLYIEYKSQYDTLNALYEAAAQNYEQLLTGGGSEDAVKAAEEALKSALALRDEYKQGALASIANQILQIDSTLRETNLNVSEAAIDHQLSQAKREMDSAQETVTAYTNKMIVEYNDALTQLRAKAQELQYTQDAIIPRETLLADLENSYRLGLREKEVSALTQIDSSLLTLENQLNTAKASLRLNQLAEDMYRAGRGNNTAERNTPVSISYMRLRALADALEVRESLKYSLLDLHNKIEQTEQQVNTATVTASRSGVINRVRDISSGDIIGPGEIVSTIVPSHETAYKMQLYVSNKDIAGIEEGAVIRYHIAALPSRQYGTIEGFVTFISTDSLLQNNQRSGYYLVEGSINADILTDRDGNRATIATGMLVEGRIVKEEKRIISYLLEKINLS